MVKSRIKKCQQCGLRRKVQENRKICQICRDFNQDLKSGRVLPIDYPDTTCDRYKEPMERVTEGFGFYGAITQTNTGSHIQCHICGFFYANVGAHVKGKHKIDVRDYKYTYGLRIKDGLLSPQERELAQLRYCSIKGIKAISSKGLKKANQSVREKIKAGILKPGGDMWTAQTRNEKGMCREQTLAKIRHVADINGGIATLNDFIREYGDGQKSVVDYWFGTWDKGVKAAGLEGYFQRLRRSRRAKRKDIISKIKDFYAMEGRSPMSSDFNSRPDFPAQKKISELFGTLNKARKAAGVPEIVYLNGIWQEVNF